MAFVLPGTAGNYLQRAMTYSAGRGTIMGRGMLLADRNDYSTFWQVNNTDNAQFVMQTGADGTTLGCYIYDASVTGRSLIVGRPYHLAMIWDGTSAKVFVDGDLDITVTATGSTWNEVRIGQSYWTEQLNGMVWNLMSWNFTFTQDMIRQQMRQAIPIRWADLVLWCPTLPGVSERVRDYSGKNNHLSSFGTLITDAPNPPLPWTRKLWMVPFVVASGDQNITVTDAGSGTDSVVVGTGLETDTFTDADGTALATHDSDWVINFGGFAINSNSAHADASGSISMAHREGNIWPADQYAEVTVAAIGSAGSIGVAVRCTAGTTATGYVFYSDLYLSYLFKYVNGSFTQIGTTGSPFQAGDVVRLEAIGTTLRPLVNGQLWAQGELTDASIASGYPGIGGYGNSTGSRIDDWVGSGLDATMQLRSISDAGMGADALGSLAVSLALVDTGAGNDAFGAAADVATVDAGSGSDSIAQLLASLLLAESGAGADALAGLTVALTAADRGAGSDAIASLAARITTADAGSGSDALASLAAALGVADSGIGADTLAGLGAALEVADTAAGTDALAGLAAALSVTDAGAGADALGNLAANLSVADGGVGADSPSISVTLSVADSGAGVDEVLQLILIAIADAGTAVDSLANIAVALTLPDSGAGSEALAVQVAVNVSDAGSGDEAINLLTEALKQVIDSGLGSDLVLSPAVSLTVLDSGAGYDAAAVSVTVTVADAGSAAEALSVIATMLVSIVDSGSGSDALSVSVAPIVVADAGTGDDAPGIAVALTLADAGAGSDSLLTSVLLTVADAAAGTDAVGSITVNVAVGDIGQAVDVLGQIDAVLSVLDLGTGVDVAVHYDSAVKLVKVVFTLARRTMAFAWLARSIEFAWSRRTVEFALNS